MDFALGDSDELLTWLGHITGKPGEVMEEDASWRFEGPGGMGVGLSRGLDPVSTAVSAAMAVCGMYWPMVLPTLLNDTNKLWRAARAAAKKGQHGD